MIKGFFMLDDLLLFVMLVENNYSFSKVSELAQIQQSTVSKRITKLESKLNRRLLIRDTRNSTITSYGLFIYEKYRHLNSPLYNIFDQDIANDNSKPKWKESRKTKLTLRQIRKLRKMLDVRNYEKQKYLKKVHEQYGASAAGTEQPTV